LADTREATGGTEAKPFLRANLPFSYVGPGGHFPLRDRFELSVPPQAVRRFGLVDGDLVTVTITAEAKVSLEVAVAVPRAAHLARVRKVAVPTAAAGGSSSKSSVAWEVALDGAAVGWVSDEEACHRGLRDGDVVKVIGPAARGEQLAPLFSPAPGLTPLPRMRVLKHFENPVRQEP
jgi:anaerobic selenocysteine-containing dehydrogenase